MAITHSTVVVTPDDSTSEVGTDDWNADHVITGGTDKQVLFNDAGAIGEDAGLTYNKTTDALTIGGNATILGEASDVLALRNGTNVQTLRIYSTESSSLTNYERLSILSVAGSYFSIGTEAGGTGSKRQLILGGGGVSVSITIGGTAGNWNIASATGHLFPGSDNAIDIGTAGSLRPRDLFLARSFGIEATVTAGGTIGAQTINKAAGTVNFGAGATTLVVTNSLVTTSSLVFAVVRTNDATATIKNVVPAAGSFTITSTAAATAETSVGFFVVQPD